MIKNYMFKEAAQISSK